MKRIAVIYASEGTGHRSAAEALREWFLSVNPDGEVVCADVLDYLPAFLRRLVSGGYVFMARYAPWLWGWLYKSTDRPSFASGIFSVIHDRLCNIYLPRLERDLEKFSPDAVFFTHYFGAAPFAGRNARSFPTFCVDTDFLTHRFQRDARFAASFSASRGSVRQRAEEGAENVFYTGIPISRRFAAIPAKDEARRRLGFDKDAVTVLLSGGGIGAGPIKKALGALAAQSGWRIAVICGNNERLYSELSRKYASSQNVRIEAFVSNMEDYYAAADAAVMKPGGLSLSEALCFRLPLLLTAPIPGQEELNLRYAADSGAAAGLRGIERAAGAIKSVLRDPDLLENMKKSASKLARPNAAAEILEIAERMTRDYGQKTGGAAAVND